MPDHPIRTVELPPCCGNCRHCREGYDWIMECLLRPSLAYDDDFACVGFNNVCDLHEPPKQPETER